MDEVEMRSRLADLETDRVERKESLAHSDRVCEAICAFANDLPDHRAPGLVAVGLDDRGTPTGLVVDDELLLKLAQLRDNGNIYPFPSMRVERLAFGPHGVAVVVVEPSTQPPVKYKGRTWIMVGPRRAIATPGEEARLFERRRRGAMPFDVRPMPGATSTDLDVDRFTGELLPQLVAADVLAANARSPAHQLSTLQFTDPDGVPTATGLLFAGRGPLTWLPGAYVQFLRLEGTTLDTPILSEHRLTLPLPDLVDELEEVLRAHVDTRVRFEGSSVEQRQPNLPFQALQQIVRNAFIHRSYEATSSPVRVTWFGDRVEVQSPGGPYGIVTSGNFGDPGVTDYRNPTIASVLGQLGYVQRFGVGIQVARARMKENGNPPPEFRVEDTFVHVTLRMQH